GAAGAARGVVAPSGPGAPAAEPAGGAFAVLHGLYWLTAAFAEQRPLLLAVDDAHWSDAASLDFLSFLLPRLEELPLLLVVACRRDEPGAERGLARLATDSLAQRLIPRPLSPRATTALLADALDHQPEETFAAACHEVSGGNPFLLGELARTIATERIDPAAAPASRVRELAPERVTRTVLVRLGRLSADAQAVARAVVVLGDGADSALVAELAGLGEAAAAQAADELRAAAILDRDATPRFLHPLVRTALDVELPAGERAAAHMRAVELLRARGAGAQQLAAHLLATDARGLRATTETLLEAARAALASGAPRSAAAYLMRALNEPAPDDLRAPLLSALMVASIRSPDRELFEALLPEVLAQLERDPSLRPRWGVKVSVWMTLNGRVEDAAPLLERAIEVADMQGDAERAFRLEAQLSLVRPRTLPQTRAQLTRYLAEIPSDSGGGRLLAAYECEWHAFDGTADDATEAARRALAHDCRIFVEQPEFFAPGRPVLALLLADEVPLAERAVARALAIARERGATPELAASWWMSSGVAWARGDLPAADADIRQALAVARLGRLRYAELPLRATLTSLLVARGELAAAETELDASGIGTGMPNAFVLILWLFARGQLRFAQGRFEEAAADFETLERFAVGWGVIGAPAPPVYLLVAHVATALGDRERARALADAALARARRWGAPPLISSALRAQAATLDDEGRIGTLAEAVTVLDRSPARLARAEALTDLGAALRRARR
ncbi:LuxR family transcriptional regulator, partial [Conexibacter sp. JD483]|uniref:LuxR family transcriptional regulator n=4 Tax=Conexibacter TaxID=191494 RepID=UPI0028709E74